MCDLIDAVFWSINVFWGRESLFPLIVTVMRRMEMSQCINPCHHHYHHETRTSDAKYCGGDIMANRHCPWHHFSGPYNRSHSSHDDDEEEDNSDGAFWGNIIIQQCCSCCYSLLSSATEFWNGMFFCTFGATESQNLRL